MNPLTPLAIACTIAAQDAPLPEISITPARRYTAPDAPITIDVHGASRPTLELRVLDTLGTQIGQSIPAQPSVDLRDAFAGVALPTRAVFVQAFADGQPIGSPLVLEPLRAAPACRTVRATGPRQRGQYSKVVAWGDSVLPGCETEAEAVKGSWIAGDPVVTSGWRVYPERDAVIETTMGPMRIAFAPDAAPGTVWNFMQLAEDGFYDGTTFHRVVAQDAQGKPFVIQGGDLLGTGDGTPGYNVALEPSTLPFDFGVVGMARADEPHSAGSQFFVALSREATARLDGQYCAFAYLIDGASTTDRIASAPIGDPATGRPATPPVIQSLRLVPAPPRLPLHDRTAQRIDRAASPPPDRDSR